MPLCRGRAAALHFFTDFDENDEEAGNAFWDHGQHSVCGPGLAVNRAMNHLVSHLIKSLVLLLWLGTAAASPSARADAAEDCDGSDCVTVGDWEFGLSIGYGERSNPLHDGERIPLWLIPRVRYYGERFFLENLELGYTLLDRPALMVNVIATPGYDRMYFARWDPNNIFIDLQGNAVTPGAGVARIDLAGLDKRRLAYLAGVEFSGGTDHIEWQLQLLNDVSGVHDGSELRVASSLMGGEGDWRVGAGLGLTWKSAALVDYYYGIRPHEVTDGRSEYDGRASWNPFVKFSLSKRINDAWQWRLHWHYEWLGNGITDSPIVEQGHVSTLFFGGDYHF